jgi:hypothetical protein
MPQASNDQSAGGNRQSSAGSQGSGGSDSHAQRDQQQIADDNQQSGTVGQEDAVGISNRPVEEEQENQERLPRRGDRKEGTHA